MQAYGFAYNWFDLAVIIVLGVGVMRGRSRGMSEELLDLVKWLAILVLGSLSYRPVGRALADFVHVSPSFGYVTAYLFVLIVVRFVFGSLKRMVGEKLVGSDVFGAGEYYMGMVAGAIRFACYLLASMAVLNAVYYSPEEVARSARVQQENFGDISFPTLAGLQQTVFAGSASGKAVKRYLGHQLIVATAADANASPADTLGRRSERAVDEALGVKR